MRISDWSSDVCSSDLDLLRTLEALARQFRQADLEIFGDREMRKDMPALRDEADPGAGAFVRAHRGHVVAVDVDIAARDGDLAHDRLHQRGLADAVAAEDGRGLTRPDVEGDVPQDLALAIGGADAAQVEQVGHFALPR